MTKLTIANQAIWTHLYQRLPEITQKISHLASLAEKKQENPWLRNTLAHAQTVVEIH